MKRMIASMLLLSGVTAAVAKDQPPVRIEVVESSASERHYTEYVPGTNGRSSTNCNGIAIGTQLGNTTVANGNSNCTTTTAQGQPARTVDRTIPQVHLRAIMIDGRHVTLWCQSGFRHCENLAAGFYSAEIKGGSVWIRLADLSGKAYRAKYRYIGGW
jgi:hypothetical protein